MRGYGYRGRVWLWYNQGCEWFLGEGGDRYCDEASEDDKYECWASEDAGEWQLYNIASAEAVA